MLTRHCETDHVEFKLGLTVVALGASVRGHGAITRVVFPLLDTNTHVGTGVLLTRGAGTYGNHTHPPKRLSTVTTPHSIKFPGGFATTSITTQTTTIMTPFFHFYSTFHTRAFIQEITTS